MQVHPRQQARPLAKARRVSRNLLLKKTETPKCATAAFAVSLLCGAVEGDGEVGGGVVRRQRQQERRLLVRRMLPLPRPRRKRSAQWMDLLGRRREPSQRRSGLLKHLQSNRGQWSLDRVPPGPRALDLSAGPTSGDPILADPIPGDLNREDLNRVGRNLVPRAVQIAPVLRQSASSSTKGRRFSCRLPKSRSPKKARASRLT